MSSINQQREQRHTYFFERKNAHGTGSKKSLWNCCFFYSSSSVLVHLDPEYLWQWDTSVKCSEIIRLCWSKANEFPRNSGKINRWKVLISILYSFFFFLNVNVLFQHWLILCIVMCIPRFSVLTTAISPFATLQNPHINKSCSFILPLPAPTAGRGIPALMEENKNRNTI